MEAEEMSKLLLDEGLKLGADELVALTTDKTLRQIRFGNNEITITKTWDEMIAEVLLERDKKVLTATMTDTSRNSVRKTLKDLIAMTKVMKPHENYAPLPEGPFRYKDIPKLYDNRISKLEEKSVDYVIAAINSAMKYGAKRSAGTLLIEDSQSKLISSRNVEGERKKTTMNLSIRSLADGESSGVGITCGTSLDDFNPEKAGEEAGKLAEMSLRSEFEKPGRYNVVFGRAASAVLFDIVTGMDSAFYVDAGVSCFAGKLRDEVACERVTVYDDAQVAGGIGSTPFDDEGNPTGRTAIIENGVLRTHLHNSLTAKKHKTKSTANATRTRRYRTWVPLPWNVLVKEGEYSDEELIKEVKDGLFVNNITYVRFQDYRKGDFSGIIRDGLFKIENGEITSPVKGLRLSDNLLHLLRNVTGLSKETVQVSHWWMEFDTPSVWTPLISASNIGFTVATK
ncbi:MAG: TldD/PmbA family protein [Candidatus Bathyarchaeia archaeon]